MAHTFDNRQFYSVVSPASTRPDITNVLWEASSHSPFLSSSSSPQASPRPNHPPPSYEESIFNKALASRQNSQSSLHSPSFRYFPHHPSSASPTSAPPSYVSHSLPCTPNDSDARQRRPPPPISARTAIAPSNDSRAFASPQPSSDTKPPPPARMPKMTSMNLSSPLNQTNGMKTSTTYLNTTQVYINQSPSSVSTPPPPPPRYPLQPPAIPPRGSPICYQSQAVSDSHPSTLMSPRPIDQSLHRSSIVSSTAKRDELVDYKVLESRFHSLSLSKESKNQCHKCGDLITTGDDNNCEILGQHYHDRCAVCVVCGRSVQEKHFLVKDQLYCEEDFMYTGYHQSLEQCNACRHLITDTILQAMGNSYHLNCFKCSKCYISLDGVPFITDKRGDLFCIHDYHMTYAPRCDKCLNPICPDKTSNETVRIISMGKTFHVQCYQCQDCSMQLNDEPDRRCYPLGDTLLCQGCCRRRLISAHQLYQS